MIIGSEFSEKHKSLLKAIGRLSKGDIHNKIAVRVVNSKLDLERTGSGTCGNICRIWDTSG